MPKDLHDIASMKLGDRPYTVILSVGIIEAKGVLAKDANGLSDPYCYVMLMNSHQTNNQPANISEIKATHTPNSSPNQTPNTSPKLRTLPNILTPPIKLFFVLMSLNSNEWKTPKTFLQRFFLLRCIDRNMSCHSSSFRGVNTQTSIVCSQKTEICKETLDPKWNENFEL